MEESLSWVDQRQLWCWYVLYEHEGCLKIQLLEVHDCLHFTDLEPRVYL